MRNLLYTICLCILIFASCVKSPEDKAKALIEQHIRATLPNIDSYDPISFSSIDSAKLSYDMTLEYVMLDSRMEECLSGMKENLKLAKASTSQSEFDYYSNKMTEYHNEMRALQDSIDIATTKFTYDSTMVCMEHRFRYYDDKLERHLIIPMKFYFNSDITRIKGISFPSNGDSGREVFSESPSSEK